jgi:TRAP-type C4-dicarboxylate transport system substrate-binding protein
VACTLSPIFSARLRQASERAGIVSKSKSKYNAAAARVVIFLRNACKHLLLQQRRTHPMVPFSRLALAAIAAGVTAAPAQAQITLTYSSWVPPTHHLTIWQANWAAEVEKATSGRVKFTSLPKAPAAPPGTFDAVRDDLVDLSYVTASYTPARHILPLMAELPGAGNTAEINSVAFSRIHWKYFQKYGEYKGVKLLGVWTHGPGQMFTKKPIKTLEDFKGQKIRTGGGIAEQVANALGASAFVKPAPESYELLNSGVADGVFFPFESIASFKLDKVIGQATVFPGGLYSSAFGFFMNEDKWNKIAKADQAIIEKYSYEYVARSNGQSWDRADKVGRDALTAAGASVTAATPEMQAEAKKRSGPIIEDWIKKAAEKHPGLDARAVLNEFHAELKKVAAGK